MKNFDFLYTIMSELEATLYNDLFVYSNIDLAFSDGQDNLFSILCIQLINNLAI